MAIIHQTGWEAVSTMMLIYPNLDAAATPPSTWSECLLRIPTEILLPLQAKTSTVMPTRLVELTALSSISWKPIPMLGTPLLTSVMLQTAMVTITTVIELALASRSLGNRTQVLTVQERELILADLSMSEPISIRMIILPPLLLRMVKPSR